MKDLGEIMLILRVWQTSVEGPDVLCVLYRTGDPVCTVAPNAPAVVANPKATRIPVAVSGSVGSDSPGHADPRVR
jgi:hypothetical protein